MIFIVAILSICFSIFRCLFTTLNPITAVMDPKQEPLRTLRG